MKGSAHILMMRDREQTRRLFGVQWMLNGVLN
jgi:hypothetical protein